MLDGVYFTHHMLMECSCNSTDLMVGKPDAQRFSNLDTEVMDLIRKIHGNVGTEMHLLLLVLSGDSMPLLLYKQV